MEDDQGDILGMLWDQCRNMVEPKQDVSHVKGGRRSVTKEGLLVSPSSTSVSIRYKLNSKTDEY